jgi:hypothetical protein
MRSYLDLIYTEIFCQNYFDICQDFLGNRFRQADLVNPNVSKLGTMKVLMI